MSTSARMNPYQLVPGSAQALRGLQAVLGQGPLDRQLRELVWLRVSQLNGCAYCVELHTRHAREAGVDQQRLDLVAAWRDAGCFGQREHAALALAEAVTRLTDSGVPDALWAAVTEQFTEHETAHLLLVIGAMNMWNRISIATRTPPSVRRDPPC